MKEKGFTLIELLAVIVILAIIALIATPIVLNIIEDSKKSAFVQTGNGIVDAAEYYYMKEMSDGAKPTENKVFTFNGSTTGLEVLEFDGEIPKEGTLTIDVNGKVELVAHNNQYCIIKGYEDNEITIKDYDGNCKAPKLLYENGDAVYFDVKTGKSCTNYHEDNSKAEYNGVYEGENSTATTNNQNSCLKFYAFNDSKGSKKVNLLLDHNTTSYIRWGNYDSDSKSVRFYIFEELKNSTDEWYGTITPDNYLYNKVAFSLNYEVDYSQHKARLITAQEIAKITGADVALNWKEEISDNWYYLQDLSQDSTTGNGNICASTSDGCTYGWLYDRNGNCTNYGCLNNSNDLEELGYMTSTLVNDSYIWYISFGSLRTIHSDNSSRGDAAGIRPVIEVFKSNLS